MKWKRSKIKFASLWVGVEKTGFLYKRGNLSWPLENKSKQKYIYLLGETKWAKLKRLESMRCVWGIMENKKEKAVAVQQLDNAKKWLIMTNMVSAGD